MVAMEDDEAERPPPNWNAEGADLSFLRDEGLELLAQYRKITDDKKRRLIRDMVRLFASGNDADE